MTPIIGFLVQCAICPQQALIAQQPDGDWLCPRCAEVAPPQPECLCPPALGGTNICGSPTPCPAHFSGLSPAEWWQLVSGAHRYTSGFGDVDIAAAEPSPTVCPDSSLLSWGAAHLDDEYPIAKVQG
ncbi:hypothetical protein ACQI4L_09190 [Mycolicibacterium litorale]|uniref:hypothetical protein n=1 Tax=Mycolicibacterium litorale TaxID=758802 RepID=UPI003CF71E6F